MAGRYQRSLSFGAGDYDRVGNRRSSGRNASVIASTLWSIITPSRPAQSSEPTDAGDIADGDNSSSHETEERKQADAWTQATYNAVALVFVFVTGCIVVAVYYILEPFLHPLLWAVLLGTVLHPIKQASTSGIREWLCYLDTKSIPLSVGITLCPFFFVNWLTVQFENIVVSNWKTLLYSLLGITTLWLMYALNVPVHCFRLLHFLSSVFRSLDTFMNYASLLQLCSIPIGFMVLLLLSKKSEYITVMKVLSVSLWFLTLLNVGAYLFGNIAIPVVAILFLAASVVSEALPVLAIIFLAANFFTRRKRKKGLVTETAGSQSSALKESRSETDFPEVSGANVLEKGITLETAASLAESEDFIDETTIDMEKTTGAMQIPQKGTTSAKMHDTKDDEMPAGDNESEKKSSMPVDSTVVDSEIAGRSSSKEKEAFVSDITDSNRKPTVSFNSESTLLHPEEKEGAEMTLQELATNTSTTSTPEPRAYDEADSHIKHNFMASKDSKKKARGQSNQVFLILTSACLVVLFWRYPLFLLMLVPLTALWLVKYLISLAVVRNSFICKLPEVSIAAMLLIRKRKKVLFPSPMPMLVRMYLFVDKKVLNFVKHSTGSLLSAFIIISLVLVSFSVVILLIFEIQVELAHYMGVAVGVWNRTVAENPQLTEWIGEGNESLHSTFGAFADQSYVYGREWLANKLHSLVSDSGANTSIIEKRILDLFDQLYQSFVLKNTSSSSLLAGHQDNATVGYEQNEMLWYELKKLASDNLETIITVLQSLWFIFSENIAVAFSFLYAVLELLFSGGTALLNVVVFITALFYLLSYSEEDYLPVKWVTDLLPHLTQSASSGGGGGEEEKDHGRAFSRAIRALFYGLYTWLIHTMFGLPVSILPSVLAALAGAMPFVGSYWLAVPAVLELWLLDSSPLAALTLLVLSLLPYFFVETLINREIEGGHPYLTGLAIAGGIYFAGLEGALFGPILLCCLLFFIDFYGGVFN